MAQKPIQKVSIKSKESKYKKVLGRPKTDSERVSKKINNNAIKQHEEKYKVLTLKKTKEIKKQK